MLVQQKSSVSMKPIKTSEPSSLSPKPRLTPYTLPFGLTMHAADSVQRSSSAYMSKDDQSKRPIEANLGRRLCNSTPLTSSNVSTTTLMRLVPRPECSKHLQNTMPVNKPKSKKSRHTSGQGNNQTTRINGRNSNGRSDLGIQAGVKVGTNQPAVHPLGGTRKGKDPSWLAVTSRATEKKKKKKTEKKKKKQKLLPARENEPVASPVSGLWTSWCRGAPQHSSVAMPGPLNRLANTTLPLTPALEAFIGPKQRKTMIVLEMAAGTCHWVSTVPDGIDTTDEVFSSRPRCLSTGKAALCLPHWIEQCRWDSMHLAWLPPVQMLCQQAAHARPKPTSLQIRTNVNLYNMHSRPNRSSVFHSLFAELVSPLMPIELCCAQSAHALCSACCPLAPLGGGVAQKKKKEKWGEMSVLSDPLSHLGASMSVLRSTPILFLVSYPLLWCPKKKMVVGRMTTHASYICYAASRCLRPCLLLLPSGALFADRDGLSTAVSAFGRFLRSIFFFALITF